MERSLLARLSPKLRNNIYELALYERRPVAISKNFSHEPALLHVCKQVRTEAELMFYAVNRFTCMTGMRSGSYEHLLYWLDHGIAQKLFLIRSLTIGVEMSGHDFNEIPTGSEGADPDYKPRSLKHHMLAGIRKHKFGDRAIEAVVNFEVNGVGDGLTLIESSYNPGTMSRKQLRATVLTMQVSHLDEFQDALTLGSREGMRRLMELQDTIRKVRVHKDGRLTFQPAGIVSP